MSSRFHTPPAIAGRLVALVVEAVGGTLPSGVVLEPSVGGGVGARLARSRGGTGE